MMPPPPQSPPLPPRPPPPPSMAPLQVVNLVVRLISLVTMILAIGILCSNSITIVFDNTGIPDYGGTQEGYKISFKDVISYRYMLSTAVIGLPYTILQIGLALARGGGGGGVGGLTSDSVTLLNFYGDKIASYLLVTGSAAGFAVTNDIKHIIELTFDSTNSAVHKFLDKGFASASLLLIAFLCVAFLSISSSFNLPRKTTQ